MALHDAIGIDPDSRSCCVCLVRRDGTKPVVRDFPLSRQGREALVALIAREGVGLVGIEGRRGQSSPLERFFSEQGIAYYSIPAVNIASYRTAMVRAQKSNRDDARAVAEFLLDLESKGQLEPYRSAEGVDEELRVLARERLRIGGDITVLTNRLWKAIKECANDLYLALSGGDEEPARTNLHSKRFLRLCAARPELNAWCNLGDDELKLICGGRQTRGWQDFARVVRTAIASPVGPGHRLVIKQTAENLLRIIEQRAELEVALETALDERPAVAALRDQYKGLGNFGAALIVEEIVTITRFKDDDHLASYAGLTKRAYSTGTNKDQRQPASCNKRLKSGFISFAKSYLLFNKGSHFERYHQNLLKHGMSRMEALKRCARALEREVYRFMKQQFLVEQKNREPVARQTQRQRPLSPVIEQHGLPALILHPYYPGGNGAIISP